MTFPDLQPLMDAFQNYPQVIGLFFIVAILYSSVGFGGGSSYLAILSMTSLSIAQFRAIALLCNIIVVSGGTYFYIKNGLYNWEKVLPIILLSVPLALLGGYLRLSQGGFYLLLGFILLGAAILMLIARSIQESSSSINEKSSSSIKKNSSIGGGIGFISGVVGIGGGVFLAPFLHLSKWDNPKKIAATCSFFILINSIAGLVGQYIAVGIHGSIEFNFPLVILLLAAVFVGGQIGSRLSSDILSAVQIKRITAILIGIVGFKLIFSQLF